MIINEKELRKMKEKENEKEIQKKRSRKKNNDVKEAKISSEETAEKTAKPAESSNVKEEEVVTYESPKKEEQPNNNYQNNTSNSYTNPNYYNNNSNNQNLNQPKKSHPVKIILLSIFIFIIVLAMILVLIFAAVTLSSKIEETVNESESKTNIQLQHTETTTSDTTTSDGSIYITDVSAVVENVMPSIVAITSKTLITSGYYGYFYNYSNGQQYSEGAGSGIIVSQTDSEIMILTNNHVVEGASELSVQFIDGQSVDATIKGSSSTKDIAIISVPIKNIESSTLEQIKIATIGDSNNLKVGNGVIAIGNALGYGQSVTTGVISALNRQVKIDNITKSMIQIDAAINGGNSGGALLNSKGEVIGINSAKYSSSGSSTSASVEGMGFAIPISDVEETITKLMNGETISDDEKACLGISGSMTTDSTLSSYNLPEGFYIASIEEGSGAEKAGLAIGNIITKIDDVEVTSYDVLSEYLSEKKAGDKVKITYEYVSGREYKSKEVTVTLSKYSDFN